MSSCLCMMIGVGMLLLVVEQCRILQTLLQNASVFTNNKSTDESSKIGHLHTTSFTFSEHANFNFLYSAKKADLQCF
jgi:hypothetical protein